MAPTAHPRAAVVVAVVVVVSFTLDPRSAQWRWRRRRHGLTRQALQAVREEVDARHVLLVQCDNVRFCRDRF
jgi:hypothetical protein